jgi:hypothetical protein
MNKATVQEKVAQQVLHLLRNFRLKITTYINKAFYSPNNAQVIVLTTTLK